MIPSSRVPPRPGPREPWRTLGLVACAAAVTVLALATFTGLLLAGPVWWLRDRLFPPATRRRRVGTKVANWKSLRESRAPLRPPEGE